MADATTPQDDTQATGGQTTASTGQQSSQQRGRIPAHIAEKHPQLEALIAETESMTQEERDYWFQIMPIMTEDQILKLEKILIHEKEQLQKLDAEYEAEMKQLNEKHLVEWKAEESRKQREERQKAEQAEEKEEAEKEAALLEQLENVDNGDA